ncbi:MAG: Gfo/Idh/MocA family protein [Candidatus Sumerlaeia bacterium]
MIKACIIGVSGYGTTHYNDLMREVESKRAEVVAAAIINQDEEKEKCDRLRGLGCELFEDYKEMLDQYSGKADICFIPTGIYLHAPMTIDALEAGMNVYVEKPVAATIQDVQAMQAARDKAGKFVAVGYQTMYAGETEVMKRAIVEGKLGKIKYISSRGLWPRNRAYYTRNNWAGKVKVGDNWVLDSPYNNALAHQLNMICFLAGTTFEKSAKIKSVQAELYRANPIESADTGAFRIITQQDIPLYFYVSHSCESTIQPDIVVEGEKGRIRWEFLNRLIMEIDGERTITPLSDFGPERVRIFDALVSRVEGENSFICDLEIAGTQTLVMNAAHESCPIHTIPEEHWRKEGGDNFRVIVRELDNTMLRAHDTRQLFSEYGAAWAKASKPINVEKYKRFSGIAET